MTLERKANRDRRVQVMQVFLSAHYPVAFGNPVLPLAIGIKQAIFADNPGISAKPLDWFLYRRTRGTCYLTQLCKPGAQRVNLDGTVSGPVSEADRQVAFEHLTEKLHGRVPEQLFRQFNVSNTTSQSQTCGVK